MSISELLVGKEKGRGNKEKPTGFSLLVKKVKDQRVSFISIWNPNHL